MICKMMLKRVFGVIMLLGLLVLVSVYEVQVEGYAISESINARVDSLMSFGFVAILAVFLYWLFFDI